MAVQNIEAEVAHLGLDDPEAPPLCAHHDPRVVAVLLLPPLLIPVTAGHPWDLVTTALYATFGKLAILYSMANDILRMF